MRVCVRLLSGWSLALTLILCLDSHSQDMFGFQFYTVSKVISIIFRYSDWILNLLEFSADFSWYREVERWMFFVVLGSWTACGVIAARQKTGLCMGCVLHLSRPRTQHCLYCQGFCDFTMFWETHFTIDYFLWIFDPEFRRNFSIRYLSWKFSFSSARFCHYCKYFVDHLVALSQFTSSGSPYRVLSYTDYFPPLSKRFTGFDFGRA